MSGPVREELGTPKMERFEGLRHEAGITGIYIATINVSRAIGHFMSSPVFVGFLLRDVPVSEILIRMQPVIDVLLRVSVELRQQAHQSLNAESENLRQRLMEVDQLQLSSQRASGPPTGRYW